MSAPEPTAEKPLRVLHCFRAPVGGLFRHVRDQVRFQHAGRHDIGIVCAFETGGAEASRVLDELAPLCTLGIHRIPLGRTVGPLDAVSYRKVRTLSRSVMPDILHGHGAKGGALARLIASRTIARAVYTPHGGTLHYEADSLRGRFYLWIEQLLRDRSDGIIFESRFAERAFRDKVGEPKCPYRIIPNGLADDEFTRLPSGVANFDFAFVGELRKIKGLDTLLKALRMLRDRHSFRLLIVGDGQERERYQRVIRETGLESHVQMTGAIHPGREAIANGRCIVVPSLHESFPYIVLEAAAAAKPVIASDVGGIGEIFGPQADRLIAAGSAPALANAMAAFLTDSEAAQGAADLLREHVRTHFIASGMAAATIDLYRQLAMSGR